MNLEQLLSSAVQPSLSQGFSSGEIVVLLDELWAVVVVEASVVAEEAKSADAAAAVVELPSDASVTPAGVDASSVSEVEDSVEPLAC